MSLLLRPFRPEDEAVAVAAHRALARDDYTFLLGYVNECRGWNGSRRESGSVLVKTFRQTGCIRHSWQPRSMVLLSAVLPYALA